MNVECFTKIIDLSIDKFDTIEEFKTCWQDIKTGLCNQAQKIKKEKKKEKKKKRKLDEKAENKHKKKKSEPKDQKEDILSIGLSITNEIEEKNPSTTRKSKHSDPKVAGIRNMIIDIKKWGKDKKPDKYWIIILKTLFDNENIPMCLINIRNKSGIDNDIVKRTIKANSMEWNCRSDRKWLVLDDKDPDEVRESMDHYKIDDKIWLNNDFRKVCEESFK